MKRILTAAVLIAFVLAGTRWAPLPVFWAGVAALAMMAQRELNRLLGGLELAPLAPLAYAGTLLVVLSFGPEPYAPPLPVVLVGLLLVVSGAAVFVREEPVRVARRLVGTLIAPLYLGLSVGHVGGLLTAGSLVDRERGEDLLIFALLVCYLGDSFAYYGGKTFGRHKLAPRISPKKTWEGAISAVLGGLVGAVIAAYTFYTALPIAHALALGVLLVVAGVFGDLAESLLKRAAAIKDSGGLLPGHGGVLDRIDSLLFAAPVLYWYHWYLLR